MRRRWGHVPHILRGASFASLLLWKRRKRVSIVSYLDVDGRARPDTVVLHRLNSRTPPPLCGPTQIIAPVAPSSRREQAIFSFGSIGWPTRPDNIGSVLYTDCERVIDLWKCLRANSSSWSSMLRFLSFWFAIIKRRARRKTTHSSPSKSSQHYPWLQLKQVVIPLHDQMFRSTKISNFESVNSQLIILSPKIYIYLYLFLYLTQ